MPLTVFDCKDLSAARLERIEAAVTAAGQRFAQPYEAWIAADPFRSRVRVLITGPQGFDRTVTFALDEEPKRIVSPAARPARGRRAEETLAGARRAKAAAAATPAPAKAAAKKLRLSPAGARADHRGSRTGPESSYPKQRGQEISAGDRAAEGG
jgi:hypothetical protein